jgi:glycosyltransferase involved in cell wall biosynthesis/ubiquinone/menaquinone biosynthesis C-methylase UbiE
MTARVTIAIPCYNQAVFLFECLNSLIAQTVVDWEALVVDDCSPDGAVAEIIANYNDHRIRYVRHQENRGLAASRNTAIRTGSAPAVLCLDADDFLHPEFLSATLDAMERDSVDCAFANLQCVGLVNSVWFSELRTPGDLAESQWIPGAGVIMRKAIWERVGGFCEAAELRVGNEDWDFWIRAMSSGLRVVHVPRSLYFYRRRANSMGPSVLAPADWKTRKFILQRHPEFFAVGDRAKIFLTGGLLRSAEAKRRTGHGLEALFLTSRAVALDPKILFWKTRAALGSIRRRLRNLLLKVISSIRHVYKVSMADKSRTLTAIARDWDSLANTIHNRDGYLSHDYSVLGKVIRQTGARSVLEMGCGSGRLMPVYLLHDMNPIWAHDISSRALNICRKRFSNQPQIRYVAGSIEDVALDTNADLVVSTRVLQHIPEDEDVRRVLRCLADKTNRFFINEASAAESEDPYIKGRDYNSILSQLGFQMRSHGELEAEGGARQLWQLFERKQSTPR